MTHYSYGHFGQMSLPTIQTGIQPGPTAPTKTVSREIASVAQPIREPWYWENYFVPIPGIPSTYNQAITEKAPIAQSSVVASPTIEAMKPVAFPIPLVSTPPARKPIATAPPALQAAVSTQGTRPPGMDTGLPAQEGAEPAPQTFKGACGASGGKYWVDPEIGEPRCKIQDIVYGPGGQIVGVKPKIGTTPILLGGAALLALTLLR